LIRVIVGAIRDSLKSGLFDRRKDRHVVAVTYELDGQAWKEAKGYGQPSFNWPSSRRLARPKTTNSARWWKAKRLRSRPGPELPGRR